MLHAKHKRIIQVSFLILAAAFIIAGVLREEVLDVISNATLICFSCIGIK
ncbi:CD1871A family CXXC motif-containing protein [Candidatus Latescibacterota bacterium]